MTKLLIKLFIKNSHDVDNPEIRNKYGTFSGIVGIVLNILLFTGKLFAGIISCSVSITADAINNLSDAGSSIITLVGFKMAGKPADNEHPFGHGRYEYVSGFTISMVIILLGFEIGKTSISKIISPDEISFSLISIIILGASVLVKLWMCLFNRKLGNIINSNTMKATSLDSLSDVMATMVVIIGIVVSYFTGLKIDGYLGVAVALFIIYTGFSAAKGMLDQLLGEAPDKELLEKIKAFVLKYDNIIGVHDIIVHSYGAGRCIVSLHAEVPCDIDMLIIHDVIDNIESQMNEEFRCQTVIHMDPIEVNNEKVTECFQCVFAIIRKIDENISMHDFRMVSGDSHTNLIFDVAIPFDFKISDAELIELIKSEVKNLNNDYNAVVEIDKEPR